MLGSMLSGAGAGAVRGAGDGVGAFVRRVGAGRHAVGAILQD